MKDLTCFPRLRPQAVITLDTRSVRQPLRGLEGRTSWEPTGPLTLILKRLGRLVRRAPEGRLPMIARPPSALSLGGRP